MSSLAPADKQLASRAADRPTATACCPIFLEISPNSLDPDAGPSAQSQFSISWSVLVKIRDAARSYPAVTLLPAAFALDWMRPATTKVL